MGNLPGLLSTNGKSIILSGRCKRCVNKQQQQPLYLGGKLCLTLHNTSSVRGNAAAAAALLLCIVSEHTFANQSADQPKKIGKPKENIFGGLVICYHIVSKHTLANPSADNASKKKNQNTDSIRK